MAPGFCLPRASLALTFLCHIFYIAHLSTTNIIISGTILATGITELSTAVSVASKHKELTLTIISNEII